VAVFSAILWLGLAISPVKKRSHSISEKVKSFSFSICLRMLRIKSVSEVIAK